MVQIEKQTCIRVCSELNEWIDCIFAVDPENADRTVGILEKAYDDWWKVEGICFGDWLENSLAKAGIKYEVFYKQEEEETE